MYMGKFNDTREGLHATNKSTHRHKNHFTEVVALMIATTRIFQDDELFKLGWKISRVVSFIRISRYPERITGVRNSTSLMSNFP